MILFVIQDCSVQSQNSPAEYESAEKGIQNLKPQIDKDKRVQESSTDSINNVHGSSLECLRTFTLGEVVSRRDLLVSATKQGEEYLMQLKSKPTRS